MLLGIDDLHFANNDPCAQYFLFQIAITWRKLHKAMSISSTEYNILDQSYKIIIEQVGHSFKSFHLLLLSG